MIKEIPKEVIQTLKMYGANIVKTSNGLILRGDWKIEYNDYHEYFIEIRGALYELSEYKLFNPEFLPNLKVLYSLFTPKTKQHPDFLKNLEILKELDTSYTVQDPKFLRNLKKLDKLFTDHAVQDPDFLKQITEMSALFTLYVKQHPDFLPNLKKLTELHTYVMQDRYFLLELDNLSVLYLNPIYKNDYLGFIQRTRTKRLRYII